MEFIKKFSTNMPREEYDYLTDATRDVLTDNVKAIASGWDKCSQWIYQILSVEKKDPFAYFRSIYEGVLKGKVSTAAWDNDLEYLRIKYASDNPAQEATDAFSKKFKGNNQLFERYLAYIADGKLTLTECKDLESLIDIEEITITALKTALKQHRAKLEVGK